jgi:DNA gyrase subunit B
MMDEMRYRRPFILHPYERGGLMMPRDLEAELDALRIEVRSLAEAVDALRAGSQAPKPRTEQSARGDGASDHEVVERLTAHLVDLANAMGATGAVSYFGYYNSGDRVARWATEGRTTDELLNQDDGQVAGVLAALGNKQRLALLKAILEKPASAAELVERLGMGTTGQVYHHLKALQAADLVAQEERGQFAFRGHRVQSLLMLLAGVRDMLDTRYAAGHWEAERDAA